MMDPLIKFTKLRYRNILSSGNVWTEIDLTRSPSTIITGKNGGGKSTMAEALTIAVTGQTIRKLTKAKIVNNKTKRDAATELYWERNGVEYAIKRTIKPDSLEIWENGIMTNQEASVKQMQSYIYKELLKTDRISWQITHMISKSGIQMFMSLKTEERRQFIDNMLGTQVFTVMAKSHRAEVDKVSAENTKIAAQVTKLDALLDAKDQEIATYLGTFEDAYRAALDAKEERLALLQDQIESASQDLQDARDADDGTDALNHRRKAVLDALKALEEEGPNTADAEKRAQELDFKSDMIRSEIEAVDDDKYEALIAKRDQYKETLREIAADIRGLENQRGRLKEGVCDVCGMEATPDHIAAESEKISEQLDDLSAVRKKFTTAVENTEKKIAAVDEVVEANRQRVREAEKLEREVADLRKDIAREVRDHEAALKRAARDLTDVDDQIAGAAERKDAAIAKAERRVEDAVERHDTAAGEKVERKDQDTDTKLVKLRGEMEEMEAEFAEICEKRDTISLELEYLNVISAMLKEGGVKTTIVRKFMPQVNRIVNESMHRLGMNAKFTMDENFDESIIWNGQEYEFAQLSEGERLRVNVSLLMAWREIARMQSRLASNFLFFDEILGESLDEDGYSALEDIFEKSFGGLNVFMITHSPEKVASFMRSGIVFEKHKGFSRIAPESE